MDKKTEKIEKIRGMLKDIAPEKIIDKEKIAARAEEDKKRLAEVLKKDE